MALSGTVMPLLLGVLIVAGGILELFLWHELFFGTRSPEISVSEDSDEA